jgi:hypothetical protein
MCALATRCDLRNSTGHPGIIGWLGLLREAKPYVILSARRYVKSTFPSMSAALKVTVLKKKFVAQSRRERDS